MRELLFSEMRFCSGVVCMLRPGSFAQAGAHGCYVFMVSNLWTRGGVLLLSSHHCLSTGVPVVGLPGRATLRPCRFQFFTI